MISLVVGLRFLASKAPGREADQLTNRLPAEQAQALGKAAAAWRGSTLGGDRWDGFAAVYLSWLGGVPVAQAL